MRPTDAVALLDLYARLSPEDRYRRFFGCFSPDQEFVEHEAAIDQRGGVGLVVEVVTPEGRDLVAAASAERLADGDGELAMEVDPAWRGWMGGWLLDALLREAGRAGMRNLQAEVLCTNDRMLRLLRRRGYAVVGPATGSEVRVAVGAGDRGPGWPVGAARPWTLAEVPGGRWAEAGDRRGTVLTCPGPSPASPRLCPLLRGEPCDLLAGADVVVSRLRDDELSRGVRLARERLHPGVAVQEARP